jgi:acetyltransferase-like isoleucine patch superfamily enzyme
MLRKIRHSVGETLRRLRVIYLRRMGVEVGDGVFISWGAWIDTRRGTVVIGDGAVITHGSKLLSHDHAQHRMGKGATEKTRTTIGRGVVIGMNAIILPGITVGDDSIIAAGAIVTKDVPPGSLVIGYAARVVKTLDVSTGVWREVSSGELRG